MAEVRKAGKQDLSAFDIMVLAGVVFNFLIAIILVLYWLDLF